MFNFTHLLSQKQHRCQWTKSSSLKVHKHIIMFSMLTWILGAKERVQGTLICPTGQYSIRVDGIIKDGTRSHRAQNS